MPRLTKSDLDRHRTDLLCCASWCYLQRELRGKLLKLLGLLSTCPRKTERLAHRNLYAREARPDRFSDLDILNGDAGEIRDNDIVVLECERPFKHFADFA